MTDESSNERLRLFVAIPVPEPVRDEMTHVQRELQSFVPRHAIAWTKPEQFHLTLRFLGGVPVTRLEDLKTAVGAVCSNVRALRLHAAGVGFFPNARSPRVVWVGIRDAENLLVDFQRQIETAVQSFATERGAEHFAGHATLGRVRDLKRSDAGKLAAHAQKISDRVLGEWAAREVEIIRSELSSSGALHTLLAAFPLAEKIESS